MNVEVTFVYCVQAIHLGLQRKILAELGKPQSLVAPQELYQFVLLSGLASGPQLEPSLLQQRRCLLNVALEHSLGNKSKCLSVNHNSP